MCEYVSVCSFKCRPHPASPFSSIWTCTIMYRSHILHWWLTYQAVWVGECDWHAGGGVTFLLVGAFEVFVAVILHSWTHRIDVRKVAPWVHAGMNWFRVMATATRWSPQAFSSVNLWFVERVKWCCFDFFFNVRIIWKIRWAWIDIFVYLVVCKK